jgi:hypothetical protein
MFFIRKIKTSEGGPNQFPNAAFFIRQGVFETGVFPAEIFRLNAVAKNFSPEGSFLQKKFWYTAQDNLLAVSNFKITTNQCETV